MKLSHLTLAGVAVAMSLTFGAQSFAQINGERARKIPDGAAAIAVAEKDPRALALIGGAQNLAASQPWSATGHGEIWVIISKPVTDPKNPSGPKKALLISVNADTGEVIDVDTAG